MTEIPSASVELVEITPLDESEGVAPVEGITDLQAIETASLAAFSRIQDHYEDAQASYLERIRMGNEEKVRIEQLNEKRNKDLETVRFMMTEAFQENNAKLLHSLIDLDTAIKLEEHRGALEAQAVETLTELAAVDPTQAAVFVEMAERSDSAFEQLETFNKKLAYWQRKIDGAKAEFEDQSIPGMLWDILGAVVPFNTDTAELIEIDKDSGLIFDVAGKIKYNAEHLLDSSTPYDASWIEMADDVAQQMKEQSAIFTENPAQTLVSMSNYLKDPRGGLLGGTHDTLNQRNLFSFADGAALPFASLWKLLRGSTSAIAGVAGHKALQAEMAASTLSGRTLTNPVKAVQDSLPDAAKAIPDGEAGLSGAVRSILDRNAALLLQGRELLERTGFLTAEDIEAAVLKLRKSTAYDNRIVDDISTNIQPQGTTGLATILLGTKAGVPFATQGSAKAGVKAMGLAKKPHTIEEVSPGQWVVKLEDYPLDTTGAIQAADLSEVGKVSGMFKSLVLSPGKFTPKRLVESIQNSQFVRQAIVKQVLKPLTKPLEKLSKAERKTLIRLGEEGQRRNKWLNVEDMAEVLGRKPTDKEVIGYYTLKDINDFEWTVRNLAMREELVRGGWKGFKDQRLTDVVLVGKEDNKTGLRVFDPETDSVRPRDLPLESNQRIIVLKEPFIHPDGGHIKAIVVREKDGHAVFDLPQKVLSYVGGGHRIYEGKFFVKQATHGYMKGEGRYVGNPATHANALTRKEAQEYADDWEFARGIVNLVEEEGLAVRTATIKLREVARFNNMNYRQVEEFFNKGKARKDTPFEVTFDKENPKHMDVLLGHRDKNGNLVNQDWSDEMSGIAQNYHTQGRLFYSKRGEHLPGPNDEFASTIDIFKATSAALSNAMETGSLMRYRIEAIESWYAAARTSLTKDNFDNPVNAFLHGEIKSNAANKTELEILRGTIKRHLERNTVEGRKLQSVKDDMMRWTLESNLPDLAKKPMLWMLDRDPVRALRSIAFDTKLGFFDPSQMIIQTQTMLATLALSPKFGAQAFTSAPALRIAMMNQSPEMLEHLATKWKGLGVEPAEFKEMVEVLRGSGIMDVGGEVAFLSNTGESLALGFAAKLKNTRDMSRMIFFEAEKWNRLAAYGVSWRELKLARPDLDMKSVEALRHLSRRTDDYSMNMTQASAAAWQRGFLSLAGQFKAYQMRLMENLFTKNFSVTQRVRLAASQLFLYGAMGLPMVEWALDTIEPMPSKGKHILETGFIDSVLFSGWDGDPNDDTAFATRAGIGRGFRDLYESMAEGEFLTVLGGPANEILWLGNNNISKSIYTAYQMFHAEHNDVGEVTTQMLREVARHVASFNRLDKAILTATYGKRLDSRFNPVGDAASMEWLAALLGIKMKEVDDIYKMKSEVSRLRDYEKTIYTTVLKLHNEGLLNPDVAEVNGKIIASMIGQLPYERRIQMRKRLYTDKQTRNTMDVVTDQLLKMQGTSKFNPEK